MPLSTFVIEGVEDHRFEQLYQIYTDSLVPREQKSRSELEALVARPDYRFVAVEDGSIVVSFAILQLSTTEPIALLEYMATLASRRNEGLGVHTFNEGVALVRERATIVEADSERETDAKDLAIRIRRKNFYRRLGCLQARGVHYILPLPGEGDPPLMDLLIRDPQHRKSIDVARFRKWLISIYREVYNQSGDDPRIDIMLRGLHDIVIE